MDPLYEHIIYIRVLFFLIFGNFVFFIFTKTYKSRPSLTPVIHTLGISLKFDLNQILLIAAFDCDQTESLR